MILSTMASLLIILTNGGVTHAQAERVALVVGINKYDDQAVGPNDSLEFAESDAFSFADVLRGVGYHVILLTTTEGQHDPSLMPTKDNIESSLETLIKNRKPNDVVLLAFAGQSKRFEGNADCYLCPVANHHSKNGTSTLVSLKSTYQKFSECSAHSKLLIVDCFRNEANASHKPLPDDVTLITPPNGIMALFACSPSERSYELRKIRSGVFFYELRNALFNARDESGDVQFLDVTKTVSREVPRTIALLLSNTKQSPAARFDALNQPVTLLTSDDRDILACYQGLEQFRRANGLLKGYLSQIDMKYVLSWKAAAERGSTKAMILYAECLREGVTGPKDPGQARKLLLRAAELGDTQAMMNFGVDSLTNDISLGLQWIKHAAGLGNAEAMCGLGLIYWAGKFVPKDTVKAINCFEIASEMGDSQALMGISMMHFVGDGVPKDAQVALALLIKSAEAGSVDAMFELSKIYQNGIYVSRNLVESVKWLNKAAELHCTRAMQNLGVCYSLGLGVVKDDSEAIKWYYRAAQLGEVSSMLSLEEIYRQGVSVRCDLVEAAKWAHRAAALGNVVAMNNLGLYYLTGMGVAKDTIEAVKWFRKAAELCDATAMYNLGNCYSNGDGVAQDHPTALEWFRKAADAGSVESMTSLGECFLKGRGIEKNRAEAVKWYKKASDLGSVRALDALRSLGND